MLVRLHNAVFDGLQRATEDWLVGTLARLVFAGVLLVYFLNSARTKFGEGLSGLVNLDVGAYAQTLPKRMEAVAFDPSQLSTFEQVIVHAGTYGEVLLPLLVVLGLFTRLASLGMIVFIAVMTYVDITAHGVDAATIGAWFDKDPSAPIADQRALWAFLLVVLVLKGPGPVSLDAVLGRMAGRRR
jgi:putative oxidoreductase